LIFFISFILFCLGNQEAAIQTSPSAASLHTNINQQSGASLGENASSSTVDLQYRVNLTAYYLIE